MYLHRLTIEGFRKIKNAEFIFSNTTFLVGANNCAKSTVLHAIEILLNGDQKQKLSVNDFFSYEKVTDLNLIIKEVVAEQVVITGEFRNVPKTYSIERGFKGRILNYDITSTPKETGCSFIFRKSFKQNESVLTEIMSYPRVLKPGLITVNDYIEAGVSEENIKSTLSLQSLPERLTPAQKRKLEDFDEVFDIDATGEIEWHQNPGGLLSFFISKLPRYVAIPALHSYEDLTGKSGAMQEILKSLFDEVRDTSANYQQASQYLSALSAELDPNSESGEFSQLLLNLNDGFGSIFPGARLNISVDLTDPTKSILPIFNIEASSNLRTPIEQQGTGLSRSALFNLLKFRAEWVENRAARENRQPRPLIIGFEEPELYLHPSAQTLIRDFIYNLAKTESSQIIATTHSPSMIDLSRQNAKQVINHLKSTQTQHINGDESMQIETIVTRPFNIHESFKLILENDKKYVKMLMRIDETFARAFFTEKCILFEGDTEKVVIDETLRRLPPEKRKTIFSKFSFISARGKGTLIPLINYANAIGLDIHVIHDADLGVEVAERMNEPIKKALNNDSNLSVMNSCIEDVLGAPKVSRDKPYNIFRFLNEKCGNAYNDLPESWREIFEKVFA